MPDNSYDIKGVAVFECAAEGPQPRNERDAANLLNEAWNHKAKLIVIPVERLSEDFFRLKTRIAGEILQKFVTYGMRVAILGDISRQITESEALRDFVYECNRGPDIWFVENRDELTKRL
jgi:hypothetical protein